MELHERNQKQRAFFNEKIDTYDQVHESFMATKKMLAERLDNGTKKVLDLGVGTGLELIHLFELFPNASVTAIDISEKMLFELSKRSFASRVTIMQGDFFEVDFGDGYDAVISTSALHHFKPEEKAILYQKIFNSLKSNGLFLNCDKISMNQKEQDYNIYELDNNIDNYKHIDTPLTIQCEINILEQVGFINVSSSKVDKDNYRLIEARKGN